MPQRISDRILWQSIFGADSVPPPPGPNASPIERARANGAMARWRAGGSPRRFLLAGGEGEDEQRLALTARLLSRSQGLTFEQAMERLEPGGDEDEEAEEEAEEGRDDD